MPHLARWSPVEALAEDLQIPSRHVFGIEILKRFLFPISKAGEVQMTSECKGGGKFVGKWSVSVRNTTSCPVCRLAQTVRPYGGRYRIADHQEEKDDRVTRETGDEKKSSDGK